MTTRRLLGVVTMQYMEYYSKKELDGALQLISYTISKCKKMKFKFEEVI